jgi:hypothetical protein
MQIDTIKRTTLLLCHRRRSFGSCSSPECLLHKVFGQYELQKITIISYFNSNFYCDLLFHKQAI